jgi:hypothetical protein
MYYAFASLIILYEISARVNFVMADLVIVHMIVCMSR